MPRKKQRPARREFDHRPFAEVKRLAAPKTEPAPPPPPAPPPADDAEDLFAEAMAGVRPLAEGSTAAPLPPPPSVRMPPARDETETREVMQALKDLVDGEHPLDIFSTSEAIEGAIPGLDPRLLRKLRRGEFAVQDHLDLHGLTWQEARARVDAFLHEAMLSGKRCVLLIHGRGHGSKDGVPVLKNALSTWFLRGGVRKYLLAFATARPADGGAGAVYVLLRRRPGS